MKKKIVSVLLASLMVTSMLAGCGNSSGSSSSSGAGSGKFILPSMASIVLCFLGMKKHEEKRKKERIQKSGEYQA